METELLGIYRLNLVSLPGRLLADQIAFPRRLQPRLEGHLPRFSAIQTHLSCRFHLAVDFPGLRRSGSWSQIINQAQDFPEQFPRHRHLGQLERDVPAMADHLSTHLHQFHPQRVSDQCSTSFGKASVRMKLARL